MSIKDKVVLKDNYYIINGSVLFFDKDGINHYFLKNNDGELLKINEYDYLILDNLQRYGCISNELRELLELDKYSQIDIDKKIKIYKKNKYLIEMNKDEDFCLIRNVFYRLNNDYYETDNMVLLGNLKMKDKNYTFRKDDKKKQYTNLFKMSFQEQLDKKIYLTKEDLMKSYSEYYFKNYLFHVIEIEKENLLFFICKELIKNEKVDKKRILLQSVYLLEEHYRKYLNNIKDDVYDEVFFEKLIHTLIHEVMKDGLNKGIFTLLNK